MKSYSGKISLIRNSRGIYCIDTSMGCKSGTEATKGGCYGDCYAAKSANTYGYDFSKTVLRYFTDILHERQVIQQINAVKLDFVRIGCSGDPSENWEHCFSILNKISKCNKEIVIITKHWNNLTDPQLEYLSTINACINTSVSALDDEKLLNNSLHQYNRIKPYCKSVLRIVSCDFNTNNSEGARLSVLQESLFQNDNTIDTIFRPSRKNELVQSGIINVKRGLFNGKSQLMSRYNKKTYAGKCSSCHEMCGIKLIKGIEFNIQNKIVKQLQLFKTKL